jgi:small subunit ribosomal protein S1
VTEKNKKKVLKSVKKPQSKKVGEPTTMEELLAQESVQTKNLERGDIIEGVVLDITPRTLTLDIGGKSEGLVAESAYMEAKDFIKHVEVGDTLTARVIVSETPEGYAILSLRDAAQSFIWKKLEKALKDDESISVMVKSVGNSGVLVDVFGLNGFIPSSHLGRKVSKDTSRLVDTTLKAKIIELDRDSKRIVLSEKYVSEEEEVKAASAAIKDVEKDKVYDGKVATVTDFGCFVEIIIPGKKGKESIVEGLVHVSELSWNKVGKPSDVVKVGDKIKVKVISKEKGKLSFSMKQTQDDPWSEIEKKYKSDQKLTGKVVKITDFGVFIELEPGVEGLVHITKLPPGEKLEENKEVEVYIEEVNPERKKISLGLILTTKPVGYK